jgi:hypothetical protein
MMETCSCCRPFLVSLGMVLTNNLSKQIPIVPRKLLFWAEQQQVAIPGWLREDQKEGLHQEEHFKIQDDGGQANPPPPPPVLAFGPEPV